MELVAPANDPVPAATGIGALVTLLRFRGHPVELEQIGQLADIVRHLRQAGRRARRALIRVKRLATAPLRAIMLLANGGYAVIANGRRACVVGRAKRAAVVHPGSRDIRGELSECSCFHQPSQAFGEGTRCFGLI